MCGENFISKVVEVLTTAMKDFEKELPHYLNLELADLEGELWEDILGYDGMYQISNMGRVKSCQRYDSKGNLRQQRIRKQSANRKTKSLQIDLCKNGFKETKTITELVGFAFVGERGENEIYGFADSDYTNTKSSNIIIVSGSDYAKSGLEKGRRKPWAGHQRPKGTPFESKRKYIALKDGQKVGEYTYAELLNKFGKGAYTLVGAFLNKRKHGKYALKSAYGFQWETEQI